MPMPRFGDPVSLLRALRLRVDGNDQSSMTSHLIALTLVCTSDAEVSVRLQFAWRQDGGAEPGRDDAGVIADLGLGASLLIALEEAGARSEVFDGLITARGLQCHEGRPPACGISGVGRAGAAVASPGQPPVLVHGQSIRALELAQHADADVAGGAVRGWLDVIGWCMPAPGALIELQGTGRSFDGRLRVESAVCELTASSVVSRLQVGGPG